MKIIEIIFSKLNPNVANLSKQITVRPKVLYLVNTFGIF